MYPVRRVVNQPRARSAFPASRFPAVRNGDAAALSEYEGEFRRAGLPLFIAERSAASDVFNRAVPLLGLVFLPELAVFQSPKVRAEKTAIKKEGERIEKLANTTA